MLADKEFAYVQENRYDKKPSEVVTKAKGTINLLYDTLKNFLSCLIVNMAKKFCTV